VLKPQWLSGDGAEKLHQIMKFYMSTKKLDLFEFLRISLSVADA
jgi:hypothetical protein